MANILNLQRDIHEIEPMACIDFFSVQYDSSNSDALFYFHGGCDIDGNGIIENIIWQGQEYHAIPLIAEEFEVTANQKTPRPKLTFFNAGFYVSQILKSYNRLLNAKVTRQKVYLKYLDAINFEGGINPYGVPDAGGGFPSEIFFVNRVTSENRINVEFELSSALDLENVRVPARQMIARYCPFAYRGAGCGYAGPPVQTAQDKGFFESGGTPITSFVNKGEWQKDTSYNVGDYTFRNSKIIKERSLNPSDVTYVKVFFVCKTAHTSTEKDNPFLRTDLWAKEDCSKRLSACTARFPGNAPKPFGGFLGTAHFRN